MAHPQPCSLCSNPARPEFYEPSGGELCSRCGSILRRLCDLLVPLYDVEPDRISLDTSFLKDLGTDSLDRVELATALEGEFGVKISDHDAERIHTVADLVRLVARRDLT